MPRSREQQKQPWTGKNILFNGKVYSLKENPALGVLFGKSIHLNAKPFCGIITWLLQTGKLSKKCPMHWQGNTPPVLGGTNINKLWRMAGGGVADTKSRNVFLG